MEHFLLQIELWKSKRRMETASKAAGYSDPVVLTPLNALEAPIQSQRERLAELARQLESAIRHGR